MESMVTEINVVPHVIGQARSINAHKVPVQNFQQHTCLTELSTLLMAIIKMGSNNANVEVTPRDVSALRLQYSVYEQVWAFALATNNSPQAQHEFDYYVLVPTKSEIQKIKNKKFKQVALHVDRLIEIHISSDSAKLSANIGNPSKNDIEAQNGICKAAMDLFIGSGADNDNTGLAMPVLKALGTMKPDLDMDVAEVREPSPDQPYTGRPDVADVKGD